MNISGSGVAGAQPKVFSAGQYLHSAGTISPGAIGGAGTMNFQNGLKFEGGTGAFDLSGGGKVSLGSGTNDLIDVSNGLSITPSHLRFNFINGSPTSGSVYPIMRYDTLTDGSGNAIPTGTITGWDILGAAAGNYTLANDSANKELTIAFTTGTFSTKAVTWTGAQSSVWETGASANWKDTTGAGTVFFLGDTVAFTDTGAPTSVAINTIVTPASTTVNASLFNYSFAGTGSIAGTGALIKDGTSTLSFGTATSTYTGGTQLKAGIIDLNSLTQGTSATAGPGQIIGSNQLLGTGSIQMSNNTTLIMGNFNGNTSNARDAGNLPSVMLDAGATATIEMSQRGRIGGTTASFVGSVGVATLDIIGPNATRRYCRRHDATLFKGQISVFANTNGTCDFRINPPAVNTTTLTGMPNATLNLNDAGVFAEIPATTAVFTGGYQYTLGEVIGIGTLSGGTGSNTAFTWNIGRNTDFTYGGPIVNGTNVTNINKQGTSTWTLTGNSTNTGTFNVAAGTLKLDNNGSLRTPIITVASGGTFAIGDGGGNFTNTTVRVLANGGNFQTPSGFSTPANMIIGGAGGTVWGNVTHNAGTISPGASDGAIGTLSFHDGLSVNGGAFILDLKGTPTGAAGDNDVVAVTGGQLDVNTGTLLANFTSTPTLGSTYTIMTYASETHPVTNSNLSLGIRATGTIADAGTGSVTLTISSVQNAASLLWNGNTNSGLWDVAGTQNWTNGTTSDKFFNLDSVAFNDLDGNNNPVNYNIQINAYQVNPTSLVFNNNNNDYTINGTGTIGGAPPA